jgi:hypothetical protein
MNWNHKVVTGFMVLGVAISVALLAGHLADLFGLVWFAAYVVAHSFVTALLFVVDRWPLLPLSSTLRPREGQTDMARKQLKFAEQFRDPILEGTKDTTVRYGDDKDIQTGDTLVCTTPDGDVFAEADVHIIVIGPVETAAKAVDVFDWNYPYSDPAALADTLATYYDVPFDESTWVKAIHFKTDE